LPLDPRFTGSNLAKDDGFVRTTKICSMTSFREKVKPSVPCSKILQWVKEPYDHKRRYFTDKISHQVSPASLLEVSAGNCQRALVDESGMTRIQMGKHNRTEMVTVQGLPCAPAPKQ
jgi:hypothetical protein